MKSVGKESEYAQEELKPLEVEKNPLDGQIRAFPKVPEGWHVACAYNQWGVKGMAKMFICENLADMQELVKGYKQGGALRIDWYAIPDTHFVKTMTVEEWIGEEKSKERSMSKL